MREIKFRAWNNETKRMDYDFKKVALLVGMDSKSILRKQYELMQYTGLKDKNNVEIYEGDIVKFNMAIPTDHTSEGEQIYEVKCFRAISFGFYPFNDYDSDCERYIDEEYKYEVIGNIYENKDLK